MEPERVLSPWLLCLYLGILTAALGYAVLEHGAEVLGDWNVSLVIIGIGAVLYWALTGRSNAAPPMHPVLNWLVLLIPAYVALQLVPLPVFLVRILSPERGRILDSLQTVVPLPFFAPLTVNPATTFAYLFRIIGYLLVFLLVRELTARSRQPWVVLPLIGIAALEAASAYAQNFDGEMVLGTYWNRNHFAGLIEMLLPLTIAYAVVLLKRRSRYGTLSGGRALAAGAFLILGALMLLAVVYSGSKMGFLASAGGLFFMAMVAFMSTATGPKKWVGAGTLLVACLVVFVLITPDRLVTSLGNSAADQNAEGRLPIWKDTLRLLAAYPVFGSGLGTYDSAFPQYQTASLDVDFNYAHNDYLQLATECGALGFLMLAGFVLILAARAVRFGYERANRYTRYLAWGCTGAIVAIGLHSLTDYNTYIPANALTLAWILGIVAGSPAASTAASTSVSGRTAPVPVWFKGAAIALGCALLIFAPAWILLETKYMYDPQAESRFCRFGVCDTNSLIAGETSRQSGNVAAVPEYELLEALRRDTAAPLRWCDLGDALVKSGQVERARNCFSIALERGPNLPPVQLRAANFYYGVHEPKQAIEQMSHILDSSATYDGQIFERYAQEKIPLAEILHYGLPPNPRAWRAYLHYLLGSKKLADAVVVWDAVVSRHYWDEESAREYVRDLHWDHRDEAAAEAWANYLGDRRHGFMESNWVYNGDFELDPSGMVFDWRMENLNDDVRVTLDPSVAHTGKRSLKIQFAGKENVDYDRTGVTAFVKPGQYRFTAFVKADGITSQGFAFHIFDPESPGRLNITTEKISGTMDWTKIERMIPVPEGTRLVAIQIIRQSSLKFENSRIAGTAWIDTVSLSKVE